MLKKTLFFLLLAFFSTVQAQKSNRKVVWSDEFDQPTLNLNQWSYKTGDGCPELCGWGNNERQIYTDSNHLIRNGNLVIQARLNNNVYSSSRITTKGKLEYQYGHFEIRAKLPSGQGVWPW